jgi:hypothetical protein
MPTGRYNFLSGLGLSFVLDRAPTMSYSVVNAAVPEIAVPMTKTPSPFTTISRGGDKVEFSPLSLTFKVDEELANYLEIFNWMTGVGFPESFQQFSTPTHSDGSLIIHSSNMNPVYSVRFKNLTPMSLSGFQMNVASGTVEYVESTVTFDYDYYTIQKV